ncbi:hypothetical protein [Colwellia psychrerythraea]|uniref:Uncharacterized protein n=1 Tax=Colwellia psychrerythraea TaxID=28229 RepID=A0A099KN39_COLPS|nr:hypothetical protein [Colwellia psychrerythraea]KGJ92159.1 hypothetical protein ND2E_3052 [Colwellia psychrerythraea]
MADLKEKEFLDEVAQLTAKLRQEIDAKKRKLDTSPAAKNKRRKRVLSGDYEYFVYTYFPHHMWLEDGESPSEFQAFFYKRFPLAIFSEDPVRDWYAAPRGEGKSTLLTKIGPIFVAALDLLQRPGVCAELNITELPAIHMNYLIVFGAETRMPAKLLEVVKTELINNPQLQLDFPEICGSTGHWKIGEFTTNNGVTMESRGINQAVRGTFSGANRPQLLLSDDIITDSEAKSSTERDGRWDTLEAGIDYLGPPDGSVKFMGVNTVLHHDDPISRAKNSPGHTVFHFKALVEMPHNMDLWHHCEELMRNDDKRYKLSVAAEGGFARLKDYPSYLFWLKNKEAMSKGAVVSWSCVRDLYTIMALRVKNLKAFNKEMQGIPRSDDELLFDKFDFWVNRLPEWKTYGACDPSMGKNESADPSALIIGHYHPLTKKGHIEHCVRKRRQPSVILSDMIKLQKEFNPITWGFENNNAFDWMRKSFANMALDQQIIMPLVGWTAIKSQQEYIESLEPYITDVDPNILFHARCNALIEEMGTYPDKESHHHYDALVALHLWWVTAVARSGGIPRARSAQTRGSVNTAGFGR